MATQMIRVRNAILILAVYTIVASSYINAEAHSRRVSTSANLQYECKDCAMKKQKQEEAHSQEKMISIRTEIIKNQILQKLRLDKPPDVRNTTPSMLRQFLHTNHPSLEEVTTVVNERKSKEFYGKILSVAVLPEATIIPSPYSSYPSVLMSFRLTPTIIREEMVSAELWFYSNKDKRRMTIWEVESVDDNSLSKRFISLDKNYNSLSWESVKIDIKKSNWVPKEDVVHQIEITCSTCNETLGPISISEHNKPFIIIRMNSTASEKSKRSSNCADSNSHGCCKESLYINFADIGWSDWIIQPSGYMANYCKGSCIDDLDKVRWNHTTFIRQFIKTHERKASELELGICCTPSKMSSISLIYKENDNINIRKTLENMVVEECDCV